MTQSVALTVTERASEGDLRVWWVPQVPMKAFLVSVASIDEAILVLKTLARYDLFQLENNIKPDFCNVGGLSVFEDGEWLDWYSEEGKDINDLMRRAAACPPTPPPPISRCIQRSRGASRRTRSTTMASKRA